MTDKSTQICIVQVLSITVSYTASIYKRRYIKKLLSLVKMQRIEVLKSRGISQLAAYNPQTRVEVENVKNSGKICQGHCAYKALQRALNDLIINKTAINNQFLDLPEQ